MALSFVLLIGAALALRGLTHVLASDPGFDPAPILTMRVAVSPALYAGSRVDARFLEPVLAAVRATPGVAAAGSISLLPYAEYGNNFNIRYEGQPAGDGQDGCGRVDHGPLVDQSGKVRKQARTPRGRRGLIRHGAGFTRSRGIAV